MLFAGPDTRVVELRVHGILGTTPEALVDAVAAVEVAGDNLGQIVRPADRLRRPAPGPVLKADGRPLPRTLEGYVWGALTSGGWSKAIWALLFPFSLANVASWMLPPVVAGSRVGAGLAVCCRALTRVAALLLTMLLVGQVAAVALDLFAAQCLAPGSTCLSFVPQSFRELPDLRTAAGIVPLLIVLYVINSVSRVNWSADAAASSSASVSAGGSGGRAARGWAGGGLGSGGGSGGGASEAAARAGGGVSGRVGGARAGAAEDGDEAASADPVSDEAGSGTARSSRSSVGATIGAATDSAMAAGAGGARGVGTTAGDVGALGRLPGVGRLADPDAPALRALHLAGGLGVIGLVAYGRLDGPDAGWVTSLCWWLSWVVVGVSLVCALVFGDPTGARTGWTSRWSKLATAATPRRVLVGLGVVLVALVIPVRPRLAGPLPGTDAALQLVTEALGCACAALGLLLIPAALLARRRWAALPRELRPWAGGWMAAPFLALAAFLGGGFGVGLGETLRQALGTQLVLPPGYGYVTLLWGIAGVLGVVLALVLVGATAVRRFAAQRSGRGVPAEVRLLHEGRPADMAAAASAWWLATWARRHAHHVVQGLVAVLAVGATVSAVPWLHGQLPPAWAGPLAAIGVLALAFLAAWLLREVYAAIQQPDTARYLGGLADLASFWPREAHPMVPPCYALKVVPELAERTRQYLTDPGARIVLAGHSQGALLICSAMARLLGSASEMDRQRLGMVMAGAPLQWAYPRAFPAIVPHDGLAALYGDLGGRWRTLCRGTDPIGGGLTTWRRQVVSGKLIGIGFTDSGTAHPLDPAVASSTGALVLGGDHWLPDPERGPFPGRRWAPGVQGHDDYYSDPEWDRAVACATGLESPNSTTSTPMLFRLPNRNSAAG